MPIDFTPLEEGGDGIQFTAFEEEPKPTVKPGDVEGRKRQVAAQVQAEGPNQVRERIGGQDTSSITGFLGDMFPTQAKEVFGGVVDTARAGVDLAKGGLFQGPPTSIPALLEDPRTRAALGVARTIGAPFAPVANAITVGAEKANEALSALGLKKTADVVAGAGEAVANVYGVSKLGQKMNAAKAKAAVKYPSPRSQADVRRVAGEAEIATATQEGEKQVAQSRQLLKAQREEALQEAKRAGLGKADLEAYQKNADEAILAFKEIKKSEIPTGLQVREKLAKNAPLGEDVGAGFHKTYDKRLAETKASFKSRYEAIEEGADEVEAAADNYKSAVEKTLGEKGISRPLPTRAEKTAQGAKGALEVDEEASEQLADNLKRVQNAERQGLPEASILRENLLTQGSEIGENPTLGQLIRERQRLKAGERIAYQAKDDNLVRQFKQLSSGVDDDIRAASPETLIDLEQVGRDYVEQYVPYFGKRAAPRAIREGEASTVVDQIIRPARDKRAVEKVSRAMEMIGNNPEQKADLAKSFINRGIDDAFRSGTFEPAKLVKYWDTYANPTGNNNKVLRIALGGRYEDTEKIVTTLRNVKASSLDEVAENMVKTLNVSTATKAKKLDDIIQGAVKGETGVKATGQDIAATRRATKVKVTEIKKQMEADIEKLLGKAPGESGAGQFIGQLYLAEAGAHLATGNLPAAGAKAIRGTLLVMARAGFTKMMGFKRGRDFLRAAMRTTPGTVKAAAQARLIEDFMRRIQDRD